MANYEQEVVYSIRHMFPWVYLPLVTVSSLMTIILMQRKAMRSSPTSVYLTVMAVADATVVYSIYLPPIAFPDATTTYDWMCKMHTFVLFGSGDVAVWLLTATTVDRFIAVVFPLKAKQLSTTLRSWIAVVCIIVLATAKNLHVCFSRGITYSTTESNVTVTSSSTSQSKGTPSCGYLPGYLYFEQFVRPWLGLTLYAFIPIIIIFSCNIAIIWKLRKMAKIRQASSKTPGDKSGRMQPTSMTAMLMAISLAFVCLITPAICMYVAVNFWPQDPASQAQLGLAFAITDIFVGLNHSANFILYIIAGKRFRRELLLMFGCRRDNVVYPTSMEQSVDG